MTLWLFGWEGVCAGTEKGGGVFFDAQWGGRGRLKQVWGDATYPGHWL